LALNTQYKEQLICWCWQSSNSVSAKMSNMNFMTSLINRSIHFLFF